MFNKILSISGTGWYTFYVFYLGVAVGFWSLPALLLSILLVSFLVYLDFVLKKQNDVAEGRS